MAEALKVDPEWNDKLRPHMLQVAEILNPRRNRLPSLLFSARLLNNNEEEKFSKSTETETDLALGILRVLRSGGPGTFNIFCDVLLKVEDGALQKIEKFLRPNRQEDIDSHRAAEKSSSYEVTERQDGQGRGAISLYTMICLSFHLSLQLASSSLAWL